MLSFENAINNVTWMINNPLTMIGVIIFVVIWVEKIEPILE